MAFLLICAAWIFVAGYTSINAIVKAELFPTNVRALGVGLPYAITVSLFGGTAPAIALYFKSLGHEDWFYYYSRGMIFLSLLIYATMRDTKHEFGDASPRVTDTEHDRRQRAAARKQADPQQGTLGARGPLPHRQDLPPRRAAPAARAASDQGLADARSRACAEHLASSAGGSTSTARSNIRSSGILRSSRRSRRRNSCPTSTASRHGRATTTNGKGFRPAIC